MKTGWLTASNIVVNNAKATPMNRRIFLGLAASALIASGAAATWGGLVDLEASNLDIAYRRARRLGKPLLVFDFESCTPTERQDLLYALVDLVDLGTGFDLAPLTMCEVVRASAAEVRAMAKLSCRESKQPRLMLLETDGWRRRGQGLFPEIHIPFSPEEAHGLRSIAVGNGFFDFIFGDSNPDGMRCVTCFHDLDALNTRPSRRLVVARFGHKLFPDLLSASHYEDLLRDILEFEKRSQDRGMRRLIDTLNSVAPQDLTRTRRALERPYRVDARYRALSHEIRQVVAPDAPTLERRARQARQALSTWELSAVAQLTSGSDHFSPPPHPLCIYEAAALLALAADKADSRQLQAQLYLTLKQAAVENIRQWDPLDLKSELF